MTSCILAGSFEATPKVSPGDSEAKPLIFTFVPTLRRLPTHIQLADTSKFLVKIPEEPSDKSPETVNRYEYSDHMTFSCESKQERDQRTQAYPSEVSGRNSQRKEFDRVELQGMQKGDLFKAEYVFIVDSDGEDETTNRQGDQAPPGGPGNIATRPKSLPISSSLASDVVRPKIRGVDLKASSHPEVLHGMAPQQKHGQLTCPTTSGQLAHKPPAFSFVFPTNQKTPRVLADFSGASVLEEFHTRRLDVAGASVEETATSFYTTAHESPFSAWKGASTLAFSPSTQLPGSSFCGSNVTDHTHGLASEAQKKASTSHALNPREDLRTSPSPASGASLKSPSASYIPVRIVMHSLSPSPKPLTSSSHGSLSTVCSQMSSSGNLSKSGLKSPVPSRLSLLTAILKSNPSHQRPLSPASCPTFSLNSLASSTLTLDQRVKQTPSTPKKSLSSCSLTAGSTEQGDHQAPAETHQSRHLPFFTKSTPLSQVYPLFPPAPANSSYASTDVERVPGGTLGSSAAPPPLQTDTASLADVPSVAPGLSSVSSSKGRKDDDLMGPEKNRNICTYPSTLSSSALPANESPALSSPEKCFHPSPALSDLIDRSKRACLQQHPGSRHSPSVLPAPPISSAASASPPSLGLSVLLPPESSLTRVLQPNPSALHPSCGGDTSPSRPGMPESTTCSLSSLVPTPSLPVSLTRTKELISPYALSMSSGPENKKPKQYKTKPSYKAFAAIPTNTLLLEQKALDEPAKTDSNSKASVLDLPVQLCFPAQLRQQTDELCATIDKVLQDSLSMQSSDSPSRPPQTVLGSETIKTPTTHPRAAGRETKYANLSSTSSTMSESQLTKPGVIRPVPIKSKLLLRKEEEVYEPNPFSKYLDDNSGLFSEQDVAIPHKPVSLHPLHQSKLYPPAKSLLHPQTLSHADCLTPGPFSHLSSFSLRDEQEKCPTLLSQNTYNKLGIFSMKLGHPMVAIPEHDTLDSKEFLSPEDRDLKGASFLGLSSPRFLIFFMSSGSGSLYLLPFAAGEKFSDDG
ncbi:muscular LMNA-interacting protein [Acomys russatus]|uniref:muscular LMNA-interacting protein n=1 Tax=Acomys russatus TaxID=60746 RepID=UPI0021E2B459|nr:muscular LMNA-interacting protein [Acomys russatus]